MLRNARKQLLTFIIFLVVCLLIGVYIIMLNAVNAGREKDDQYAKRLNRKNIISTQQLHHTNFNKYDVDFPVFDFTHNFENDPTGGPILITNHVPKTGGSTFHSAFPKLKNIHKYINSCDGGKSYGGISPDVCNTVSKRMATSCNFFSWELIWQYINITALTDTGAGLALHVHGRGSCSFPVLAVRPTFIVAVVRDPIRHVRSMLEHGYRGDKRNKERKIEDYVDDILNKRIDYRIAYYRPDSSKQSFDNAQINNNLLRLVVPEGVPDELEKKVQLFFQIYSGVMLTDLYDASVCMLMFQMNILNHDCRMQQKVPRNNLASHQYLDEYITDNHIKVFMERTRMDQYLYNKSVLVVSERIGTIERLTKQVLLLPGELDSLPKYNIE